MTYFGDVKSCRASTSFTELELLCWTVAMFIFGACTAVVVLFTLGAQP